MLHTCCFQRCLEGLLLCSVLLAITAFVPATAAADSCSDLANNPNLNLPFPASITAAQSNTTGSFQTPSGSTIQNLPAFCDVTGVATPTTDSQIKFEVWIPESTPWNQKYLQAGCGGLCGAISYSAMAEPLRRGYAVAATDEGHEITNPFDATWAIGHPEKVTDWAYRAEHVVAGDAKAIVSAYSSAPQRSYFDGCSRGGTGAFEEAQRYPADFDGIIAGDPGITISHLVTGFVSDWLALTETQDSSLTQSDLNILSSAALSQCVGHDGGLPTDQFLNYPPACDFQPDSVKCNGHVTTNCLSPEKVAVINQIYSGPAGINPGFQFNEGNEDVIWSPWITRITPSGSGDPNNGLQELFANAFFSDLVFPNSHWTPTSTTISQDIAAANENIGILNADNPDLRPFQAAGGKMIQYSGWSDPAVSPQSNIDYYTSVTNVVSGLAATQDFYRLFMVPGMGHCAGGPGANAFGNTGGLNGPNPSDPSDDVLSALDRWVDGDGHPPDQITATKYNGDDPTQGISFQRPLCPYPEIARFMKTTNQWRCVD